MRYVYVCCCVPGQTGGTGKVFDWTLPRRFDIPVILAGGLNPSNVTKAIVQARPWCVDVAGGVAMEDGVTKDHDRIVSFVQRAKPVCVSRSSDDDRRTRIVVLASVMIGLALMLFRGKK